MRDKQFSVTPWLFQTVFHQLCGIHLLRFSQEKFLRYPFGISPLQSFPWKLLLSLYGWGVKSSHSSSFVRSQKFSSISPDNRARKLDYNICAFSLIPSKQLEASSAMGHPDAILNSLSLSKPKERNF